MFCKGFRGLYDATELGLSCPARLALMLTQQSRSPRPLHTTRACFASAADAATKEGPEAKKEAKKSLLQSFLGAAKVTCLLYKRKHAFFWCILYWVCSIHPENSYTDLECRLFSQAELLCWVLVLPAC